MNEKLNDLCFKFLRPKNDRKYGNRLNFSKFQQALEVKKSLMVWHYEANPPRAKIIWKKKNDTVHHRQPPGLGSPPNRRPFFVFFVKPAGWRESEAEGSRNAVCWVHLNTRIKEIINVNIVGKGTKIDAVVIIYLIYVKRMYKNKY